MNLRKTLSYFTVLLLLLQTSLALDSPFRFPQFSTFLVRVFSQLRILINNPIVVLGLSFILYFILLYGIYSALVSRIPVFKGDGTMPNKSGKLVAISLAFLSDFALFWRSAGNPTKLLTDILSPWGILAGFALALVSFLIIFLGFKDAEVFENRKWQLFLGCLGLSMVIAGTASSHPSIMWWGWLLCAVFLVFFLISAFASGGKSDANGNGKTPPAEPKNKPAIDKKDADTWNFHPEEMTQVKFKVIDTDEHPLQDCHVTLIPSKLAPRKIRKVHKYVMHTLKDGRTETRWLPTGLLEIEVWRNGRYLGILDFMGVRYGDKQNSAINIAKQDSEQEITIVVDKFGADFVVFKWSDSELWPGKNAGDADNPGWFAKPPYEANAWKKGEEIVVFMLLPGPEEVDKFVKKNSTLSKLFFGLAPDKIRPYVDYNIRIKDSAGTEFDCSFKGGSIPIKELQLVNDKNVLQVVMNKYKPGKSRWFKPSAAKKAIYSAHFKISDSYALGAANLIGKVSFANTTETFKEDGYNIIGGDDETATITGRVIDQRVAETIGNLDIATGKAIYFNPTPKLGMKNKPNVQAWSAGKAIGSAVQTDPDGKFTLTVPYAADIEVKVGGKESHIIDVSLSKYGRGGEGGDNPRTGGTVSGKLFTLDISRLKEEFVIIPMNFKPRPTPAPPNVVVFPMPDPDSAHTMLTPPFGHANPAFRHSGDLDAVWADKNFQIELFAKTAAKKLYVIVGIGALHSPGSPIVSIPGSEVKIWDSLKSSTLARDEIGKHIVFKPTDKKLIVDITFKPTAPAFASGAEYSIFCFVKKDDKPMDFSSKAALEKNVWDYNYSDIKIN